jgi:hypothetical protein
MAQNQHYTHWQYRLHEIIFKADTWALKGSRRKIIGEAIIR